MFLMTGVPLCVLYHTQNPFCVLFYFSLLDFSCIYFNDRLCAWALFLYLGLFSLVLCKGNSQGHYQETTCALAGVAQWTERRLVKQGVASSIPSQGTCLGCRPGPQEGAHERQPHIDVSLPLFLPPFPSLKINK